MSNESEKPDAPASNPNENERPDDAAPESNGGETLGRTPTPDLDAPGARGARGARGDADPAPPSLDTAAADVIREALAAVEGAAVETDATDEPPPSLVARDDGSDVSLVASDDASGVSLGARDAESGGASGHGLLTVAPDGAELGDDAPLVLVVEDEAPIANLLAEMLLERGCRVAIAEDGHSGLESFRRHRPVAVFCDLLLPRRNGFRLLEDFQTEAPGVPVFIMTGVYRDESYEESLTGARMFLTKPFDDALLREACEIAAASRGDEQPGDADTPGTPMSAARQPWIPTSVLPLPRVLRALRRERRTGLLTHRLGERNTVFELADGDIRFVRGNDPTLRLGRLLRQLGAVEEGAIRDAEADLASRKRRTRLGEVLVERGAIDEETLVHALQLQLRRLVADAFSAEGGETLFQESVGSGDAEDVVLDADARAIVVAGCAAWHDTSRTLLAHLPDPSTELELACDPDDENLRLTPALQRLVEAVREPTSLSAVLSMAELIGLRAGPVVYGLLCAEVLRPVIRRGVSTRHVPVPSHGAQRIPAGTLPLRALLDLEEAKATGVLRVEHGDERAWLAFRDGHPFAAGSTQSRSRLGERLVDAGLITPEQLELALFRQSKKPDQPIGRILVEQGTLEPSTLLHAVRSQVSAITVELACLDGWTGARFETGQVPPGDAIAVATTSELVLSALRRMSTRSLERLAGTLARRRPQLDVERVAPARFVLTETEELVRATLPEDSRTIMEALAGEDRSDPDVLRLSVLALLLTPPEPAPVAA